MKKNKKEPGIVNLITLVDNASPIAERYRTIRTNIKFSSVDKAIKTIVVTSPGPSEGKTTTSANLAVVFAQSGQKVLLVDADMRRSVVHKTFCLDNSVGLSNSLNGSINIKDTIHQTPIDNLFIITSGIKMPNPSELLSSKKMEKIMDTLKAEFDVVIFDMPPVVTVTDAQIVASKADATIVVVREKVTRKDLLQQACELLSMVHANILGTIYNGGSDEKEDNYYYS